MLVLRLLLVLQFLFFGSELGHKCSLLNLAYLVNHCSLGDTFLLDRTPDQDTIDKAFESLGKGLLSAILKFKVRQVLVKLLNFSLPFSLILSKAWFKMKAIFLNYTK